MSAKDDALIVPGRGTVFTAPPTATFPPSPLEVFRRGATPPVGWTDMGHTSRENAVAFSREGGDTTQLETWYSDAVRVTYGAVQWGATISALQMDEATLDLAFNGELDDVEGRYVVPASTSAILGQTVILFEDSTGSMLFWMPRTETTIGDAPSVQPDAFFAVPLALSILSSSELTVDDKPALMAIYKDTFKASDGGGG